MSIALSAEARHRYSTDDVPEQALEAYGYILLAVSGADGEISAKERRWFEDWADSIGASAELRSKWDAFDSGSLNLETFISGTRERRKAEWKTLIKAETSINYARTLVYDSIRMARADDEYHPHERDAVHRAAKMLHVDKATLLSIEALVDVEEGIRAMRRSLFARIG